MGFTICSLNVRGLGERLKRRETFNWQRAKKVLHLSFARNALFSVKTHLQLGHLNGAIKLCLAAALAPVEESQFSITIISPFSLKDRNRILKADLLFLSLKQ